MGAKSDTPPSPKITFHKNAQGVTGLILEVHLKTTIERAWSELNKPTSAPKLFGNVKKIKQAKAGSRQWTYVLDSPIGEKQVTCSVTKNQSSHTIHWKRQNGDLRIFEGHWKLTQSNTYPAYIVVQYLSYIDPGGIAGLLFTNRRRKANVQSMIPKLERLVSLQQ